jgi:predicted PurR-regulated permease PerM
LKQLAPEDAVVLSQPRSRSVLPLLYAGAIVVAALYYGQELMVPLVLAALLAFVLAPARSLLERLRLPRVVAVIVVVLLAFATIAGLGAIVGRQRP